MSSGVRNTLIVVALAAVIAAGVGVWRHATRGSTTPSVAVLPITASGDEARYFTDGFHDAVVTQLGRIQGLRVISRTSVIGYREPPRDIPRIARELGVEHVVEATVQRAGERLRVSARLADATGAEVWTADYDRAPDEIFSVQADLAKQIANAIDARLTMTEEARIEKAPTADLEAYDLYLRALEVETRTPPDKAAIVQALEWLDQALARDPEFALAHALASKLHMTIYWVVGDYDKARLPVAEEHARRAVELAPDASDAHLAMALYWYWGHREYDKALASLADAQALEPNSSEVSFLTGSIYRRLARWDVSIAAARKTAQLDPRNARNLQVYADVLMGTRNFREADQVLASLQTIAPRSPLAFMMRLQNQMRWTGDAGTLAPDFGRFEPKEDPYCLAQMAHYELLMLQRQFERASSVIMACPGEAIGALHNVPAPKQQYAAIAELFGGHPDRAQALAKVARDALNKRLAERPDLPLTRISLAYMLAIFGDAAGALAEADRALADAPMSKDAVVGAELRDQVAALHAYLRQHDRALAELTESLDMAYGSYARLVMLNPFWDATRSDPRFQRLLADRLPQED